ncbi:inositol-trisphosphate 3-kinase A-like [Dendronephthya gigantea]|uniref:inositol-trisphosphate 3-kinase A-like n=1 Tax=Dendronephthya gigantea TaxID=151771 RepID=UPI00106AA9FF|nr:inositol-trisphosphate 3-kinase A-like [Dendronephthya gigantea]
MNSRRKYKVTIRVVDHPPGTTASFRDSSGDKHSEDEVEEQKTIPLSENNTIPTKVQPVYQSSLSLQLSDKRNRSSVHCSAFCSLSTECEALETGRKTRCEDRVGEEGMLDSEFCECTSTKPLLKADTNTSLNIYKLTRNNAIDQEDTDETNVKTDNIKTCERADPGKFTTKERRRQQRHSCGKFEAKYGVHRHRNGYNRHLPSIVVLNAANMEGAGFDENLVTNTATIGNGIRDDFFPDFDALGTRRDRPPLNREGSACSSDSIITEIEGLTDDEGEIKSCSNDSCETQECAPKANNWKKIKGMIQWAPFVKSYKKKVPWVQLAGHQGNFKAGEQGTILKKSNETEKGVLLKLMKDVLRPYVPEYKREVLNHDESYLVLQDLLFGFESPSVMDCKMGVRTFLEDELEQARKKPKLRKDLYQKMIDIDPNAPTDEERKAGGISKPRYMKWREELSSSASLGFRIEGIKKTDEKPNKDFKTTRSREDVCEKFRHFINNNGHVKEKYLQRLKAIRGVLESSPFFKIHEVIGSSLLFVHDSQGNVNVWMIDFAKTTMIGDGVTLTHRALWQEGNHEDGYLFGLDNMISIWSEV